MTTWDDPNAPVWDSDVPFWDVDETQAPANRRKKMTKLQYDDVLGFGTLLRGVAAEYKDKLLAAENPHDPTAMIASTAEAAEAVGKKRSAAKTAEDEAIRLTGVAENAKQDHYASLNNWCNLMAATLGKDTPEGKRILGIRANLDPRPRKATTTPTTPPTT